MQFKAGEDFLIYPLLFVAVQNNFFQHFKTLHDFIYEIFHWQFVLKNQKFYPLDLCQRTAHVHMQYWLN